MPSERAAITPVDSRSAPCRHNRRRSPRCVPGTRLSVPRRLQQQSRASGAGSTPMICTVREMSTRMVRNLQVSRVEAPPEGAAASSCLSRGFLVINREFLKAGHLPTLLSAFFYFDMSFMVWVMLGPLAVQISAGSEPERRPEGFHGGVARAGRRAAARGEWHPGRPPQAPANRHHRPGRRHRGPVAALDAGRQDLSRYLVAVGLSWVSPALPSPWHCHSLRAGIRRSTRARRWESPAPAIRVRFSRRCWRRASRHGSAGRTSLASPPCRWPSPSWSIYSRPGTRRAPAAQDLDGIPRRAQDQRRLVVHVLLCRDFRRLRRTGILAEHLLQHRVRAQRRSRGIFHRGLRVRGFAGAADRWSAGGSHWRHSRLVDHVRHRGAWCSSSSASGPRAPARHCH